MARPKIRFKVVRRVNKKSCFIPSGSRYCLSYDKKGTVKALPDTMGIMVFKTKKAAVHFIYDRRHLAIIKVAAIGKAVIPQRLAPVYHHASSTTNALKTFYKFYDQYKHKPHWSSFFYNLHPNTKMTLMMVPQDTECYASVRVL